MSILKDRIDNLGAGEVTWKIHLCALDTESFSLRLLAKLLSEVLFQLILRHAIGNIFFVIFDHFLSLSFLLRLLRHNAVKNLLSPVLRHKERERHVFVWLDELIASQLVEESMDCACTFHFLVPLGCEVTLQNSKELVKFESSILVAVSKLNDLLNLGCIFN